MSEERDNQWAKDRAKRACQKLGEIAKKERVTHDAIAEKTGYQRANISRFMGGIYTPRMDIVFTVLEAVNELSGKNYTLDDIDVPEKE